MGVGTGEGYVLSVVFGGQGKVIAMLPCRLYLEVLGDPLKNGGPTDCFIKRMAFLTAL